MVGIFLQITLHLLTVRYRELAMSFGALVYIPARYLELKYWGR